MCCHMSERDDQAAQKGQQQASGLPPDQVGVFLTGLRVPAHLQRDVLGQIKSKTLLGGR